MKKYSYIYMLAMTGVLMTSCQDNFVEGTITRPAEVGDVILFGASANFENANPNVRTEYSGEVVGGKESIWWVPNKDRVQIYCAEAISASDDHSAHYVVKGDAQSTGKDNASTTDKVEQNYLERLHESSLQWGEGSDAAGTHTFYGMYPSQFMFRNDDNSTAIDPTLVEGITMSGTTVKGYVHNEQIASSVTKNGSSYVAKPDMRYAYMVAKTSTTRQQAITETNGVVQGVSLNFYPLVTALEVTLALPTSGTAATVNPVTIGRVSVSATDVAGSFSADLSAWDGASAYTTNATTGTSKLDEIYMRINYTENGLTMPVTLKAGESLTFTVFLKPTANVDNIKIGFASDLQGQTTKYKSLASAGIQVRKKNKISNLRLPVALEAQKVDYSNWMMQMEDNTSISGISLPGTAHSFSYGATNNNYKAQSLTFEEQWKAGIRAFEVASNRPSSTSGSFEDLNVTCGQNSVGLTIETAVNNILDKLKDNPFETAMLVFTYQPTSSLARHGENYMKSLMTYINSIPTNKLIRFEPNLTLGNYDDDLIKDADGKVTGVVTNAVSDGARGKLMIVVRPNSMYEGDLKNSVWGNGETNMKTIWDRISVQISGTNASKILVVNGCGTGKDKWGARGYTINGSRAADISNSVNTYIEQFMNSRDNPLWTTNGTTYGSGEVTSGSDKIYRAPQYDGANLETVASALKFNYTTNVNDMDCWFQEWQRVLKENTYNNIQWFESYYEKLSNAKATFDMAISGKYDGQTEGHPKYVFINSLDGYLASGSTESTKPSTGNSYGGAYGEIKALADKINPDFYAYVNQRISSAVAPTGIVFMDFVSNTPTKSDGTADPAYWLPQLIVNNNTFKAGIAPGGSGDGTDEEEDGW